MNIKEKTIETWDMRESMEKASNNNLQEIQMIVWNYMELPKEKRNGVKMAMEISNLFK